MQDFHPALPVFVASTHSTGCKLESECATEFALKNEGSARDDDCGMGNAELEEGTKAAGQWQDKDDKIVVRARNAAYRLLTYRPRSRAELRQKLQDKAFDAGCH